MKTPRQLASAAWSGTTGPAPRSIARREFCRLGIASLAAAVLPTSGCAADGPLRIVDYAWPGYQFARLGQRFGWLSPKLVEFRRAGTHLEARAALLSGDADAATLTLDEVLCLRDRGLDVSVVLVFDFSAGADALLASASIPRLDDLRAGRIGADPNGISEILLTNALAAAGLRRPDVVVVPLRGNHVDLWQAGQLDAIVTYEPWRTRLERAGLVDLFDSRRTPQLIVDVLAVRSEALFRHRPAVRAVVAAHFRALRRWQDNPVDTSFHLAAGLGIPPDEWPQALRNLDLPDVAYNREYLSGSAPELSRVARELEAILRRAGLMQASAKLDGLFVADFLPGAEA